MVETIRCSFSEKRQLEFNIMHNTKSVKNKASSVLLLKGIKKNIFSVSKATHIGTEIKKKKV